MTGRPPLQSAVDLARNIHPSVGDCPGQFVQEWQAVLLHFLGVGRGSRLQCSPGILKTGLGCARPEQRHPTTTAIPLDVLRILEQSRLFFSVWEHASASWLASA